MVVPRKQVGGSSSQVKEVAMFDQVPPLVVYSRIGRVLGTSVYVPGTPVDSREGVEAFTTAMLRSTDNLDPQDHPSLYEDTGTGRICLHHHECDSLSHIFTSTKPITLCRFYRWGANFPSSARGWQGIITGDCR